jgi:predicted PurR-regulated permease PerM
MSSTTGPSRSRSERVVAWTVLLLLLFGDVLVLRPFGSALVWAMVLVCSSWPLYSRATVRLRHRHTGRGADGVGHGARVFSAGRHCRLNADY